MLLELNQRKGNSEDKPTKIKDEEGYYSMWSFGLDILGLVLVIVYSQQERSPEVAQEEEEVPDEKRIYE